MTDHEQECLRGFERRRNWVAWLTGLQMLFVANHVWLTWRKPTALAWFGLGVLLSFLAWQIFHWRRLTASVRRYRLALRLKDEALAATGNLRVHKAEQLEAVLAEAGRHGPPFVHRPLKNR